MVFQPADWAESFSITIDHTKVDSDLENFPVLITLASGTSENSFDANNLFDALTDDNGVDEYDILIWRALADTSDSAHSFRLDRGQGIEEPGYAGFEATLTFDGTTRSSMQIDNHTDWTFDTDFTIEFYMRSTNSAAFNALDFGGASSDNLVIRFDDTDAVFIFWNGTGANNIRGGTLGDYSDGNWRHFALVKDNNYLKFYVQGIEVGRSPAPLLIDTEPDIWSTAADLTVARHNIGCGNTTATYNLDGAMSGIRISKIARYTEAFVPPTGPFLKDDYDVLLIQEKMDDSGHQYTWKIFNNATSNTVYQAPLFISDEYPVGRALQKITDEGIYTQDNLEDFELAVDGESFTIDGWIRTRIMSDTWDFALCALKGTQNSFQSNGDGYHWHCGMNNRYFMHFNLWTGGTGSSSHSSPTLSSDEVSVNDWNHLAFVNNKELNTFKMFFNGMLLYTASSISSATGQGGANGLYVGSIGTTVWDGYQGNAGLRISQGVARWVDNFDPIKAVHGVGSYANRKKIAVTTIVSGVEEETYAEIDEWLDGNFYKSYQPSWDPSYDSDSTDGSFGKFVKATSKNGTGTTYIPQYAFHSTQLRTGAQNGSCNWLSPAAIAGIGQKITVDLGRPVLVDRILLDNSHNGTGSYRTCGIKNFSVYGTNSTTAFEDTTYTGIADLTLLGTYRARMRWQLSNEPDHQFFYLNHNDTVYRYYVLRIADHHGYSYMGIRYIEFQRKTPRAKIYVKVPNVSSVSGTQINFYYDKRQEDNTFYIGDTRDEISNYVWDENYLLVSHLSQQITHGNLASTTVDTMLDSTVNNNHGTTAEIKRHWGNSRLEDVWFAPETGVYMVFGNLGSASQGTIEYRMMSHDPIDNRGPFTTEYNGGDDAIRWQQKTAGTLNLLVGNGASFEQVTHPVSGTENHISFAWETTGSGYGYYDDTPAWVGNYSYIPTDMANVCLGSSYDTNITRKFYGILDELRVSNIPRSTAWLKATYYSNINDLLTYEVGQSIPYYTYIFSGTVQDWSGDLASAPVRLYRRDTGALADFTTSTVSGTFQVTTLVSGEHYIIATHPLTGVNAIIYDRITPSGIII